MHHGSETNGHGLTGLGPGSVFPSNDPRGGHNVYATMEAVNGLKNKFEANFGTDGSRPKEGNDWVIGLGGLKDTLETSLGGGGDELPSY